MTAPLYTIRNVREWLTGENPWEDFEAGGVQNDYGRERPPATDNPRQEAG
jgi:hypothetical protein